PSTTTHIHTLSLHDALPIYGRLSSHLPPCSFICTNDWKFLQIFAKHAPDRKNGQGLGPRSGALIPDAILPCSQARPSRALLMPRSEEHTSELQSRENLVCRL